MTHSGSNCNLSGSFVSACADEKRHPSHLSSISFGTGMHIHKKGQRPIFRGVKRKKALYEANERVPIRRCVLSLESRISLSRKREALMDDNGLEGELNGRDKNHAVVNGSVNDGNSGTLPLSLQIPGPPIVLQTNFSEMSNSQAGSECFEMLKLEEPDERSQGTPRSVFSPNSPFLTTKNALVKQPFVFELEQDQCRARQYPVGIPTKERGYIMSSSLYEGMHYFSKASRNAILDIEMGFFPMHFLKDLQAANCEDGFALLEVKDSRFHSTPFKDLRRLQFDLGSTLHYMRTNLFAAKTEQLRKKSKKNQQQQSCNTVNNTELKMWPKLAKSEAAALVALVPASDLNLDPKLVPSPVTQDYLGVLSACRSWHYHCLGQNEIFHGDNSFQIESHEMKDEGKKWAHDEIEILKGFIDLNVNNNSESPAHDDQNHSLEDMRMKRKPYGSLTSLQCHRHIISEKNVKSKKPTLNINPEKYSTIGHGNTGPTPNISIGSTSPWNTGNSSFSPRNDVHQFQQSPGMISPRGDRLLCNENCGSKYRKWLLSASDKQKLQNGGLLWPISTFVMAATAFNERAKAKTDESIKVLCVGGAAVNVKTSETVWGENANSLSNAPSPKAVIDKLAHEREYSGVHSSPMGKVTNMQNEVAISEFSSASVPETIDDPSDQILNFIVELGLGLS